MSFVTNEEAFDCYYFSGHNDTRMQGVVMYTKLMEDRNRDSRETKVHKKSDIVPFTKAV